MLRLSELYTSVQGEGPNVGKPTTFVRFAGCNMRCPGWPCDTPYAIYPEQIKDHHDKLSWLDLIKRMHGKDYGAVPEHFCITGGEPLLQPHEDLYPLFAYMNDVGWTWDIFTNGSFPLNDYLMHDPRDNLYHNVTVIMDWKLPGSGEADSFVEERNRNRRFLRPQDAIKFVVKDEWDMMTALSLMDTWGIQCQIYFSPAWGVIEPRVVVDFITKNELWGVKLNLQVHKYIWPEAKEGV